MRHSKDFQKLLKAIREAKDRIVAVVIHLNDTYLIEERKDRGLPGFARLIATVSYLRDYVDCTVGPDHFLVVHSGDFLGPSLLAKSDKGDAMAELLEKVGLNYCVLGNHEFDHKAEILAERVNRRRFKVLLANAKDPTGLVKVSAGAWWPQDRQIVAITGIVSGSVSNSFRSPGVDYLDDEEPWLFEPPNEALLRFLETSRGALFRLILSHASQSEDRQLRRQIPALSRTYILGGHDHDIDWIEDDQSVFVMKNLANCETVRVCVLMAGGESVVSDLVTRNGRLQQTRQDAAHSQAIGTPRYPEDLEAVLLMTSDLDRAAIRTSLAAREQAHGPFDDLADALSQIHYRPDMWSAKLRFADHLKAAQSDIDFVEKALTATKDPHDALVVRDFTSKTNSLEARDSHVRRRPTNFGVFVAECIRLHASADVAIVNSGSFRCDSALSPKLAVRDLREAFLYDEEGGIIVLELDSSVVDALIAHGKSKDGSGGYPQFSDARSSGSGKVVVAIASYLLTKNDSNDGYAEVLAQSLNLGEPSAAKARDFATTAAAKRASFGVIEAVKAQASKAAFKPPDSGSSDTQGTALIDLLKGYTDAFFENVQADKAPLRNRFSTEVERQRTFREWLGTDGTIPSPPIQLARDNVRAFLRALPAVAAYHGTASVNWVEAWSAAETELTTMRANVAGHDFVFRDSADYAWLFDLAARGLPGWRSQPG